MKTGRGIIVVMAMVIVTVLNLPCTAAQNDQNDEKSIWVEKGPRWERGPGPGHGPRMFELSNEEIERIMKSLKERDPEKAKELEKVRIEDPNRFQFELGRYGGEEFEKIMKQRMETFRQKMQAEFLGWLHKNYRQQADELGGLKQKDPDLYWKKFDLIRERYWRIYEAERWNPELAGVLKEDLELKKTCDELLEKIKSVKDDKEKNELIDQLKDVVGRRYDLILKRKQIEYEQLLKRVEGLQKQLEENKAEIAGWRDQKIKEENVKNRINELLGGGSFKWD